MDAYKELQEQLSKDELRLLQRQEQKYNLQGERVIGLHTAVKLLEWIKLRYLQNEPEKSISIDEARNIVEAIYKEVTNK